LNVVAGEFKVDGASAVCDFSSEVVSVDPLFYLFAVVAVSSEPVVLPDLFFAGDARGKILSLSDIDHITTR
jgi:hypothetical protein